MQPKFPSDEELASFRRRIDEFDDRIIALIAERAGIIAQVGELKRKAAPGRCPIRPAREASMVRRVMEKFKDTPVAPAAAAAIWRMMIGMSLSIEGNMSISVLGTEKSDEFFWIAREHFGPFMQVNRQPHIKRVIGDVMDGKAALGILPMPHRSDTDYWWTHLLEPGNDRPKVFAKLPFVKTDAHMPSALAIARIAPEESGDDQTLLVLEADYNVSQDRLQNAFHTAGIEAHWIHIAMFDRATRHHLVEAKGFLTPEHEKFKMLLTGLGSAILKVGYLGAYATPVNLSPAESKPLPHAIRSSKA